VEVLAIRVFDVLQVASALLGRAGPVLATVIVTCTAQENAQENFLSHFQPKNTRPFEPKFL